MPARVARIKFAFKFDPGSRFKAKPNITYPATGACIKLHCSYNIIMGDIKFEWDAAKASINKKKHGVSFDEAKTVFYDENAKIIHDPEHSHDEERFIILGLSVVTRMLVVIHCYRKIDKIIRIISARKATKRESTQYNGGDL
jgi:uncharacterized protein